MTTYPTQPTSDNLIDLTNIFASNSSNKIKMSTAEILNGYNNNGDPQTPLTSTPDGNRFNYFWYQVHNTLAWVVNYTKALFDNKLETSGGTMSGAIAMGSNKVTGLANGTVTNDAVNKGQLDAVDAKISLLDLDVVSLGNLSSNFILLKNQVHTANIVGSCTLNLPNVSGSTKMVNCMIVFSLTSGQVLTMPSNIKWNYGVVPTFSTASGVKNRITFDTIDGGTTWTAYYAQIGS